MRIEFRKVGKICVLEMSGEVTTGSAVEIRNKTKDLLEKGERRFVFNMLKVPWIDTSGLGEMVGAYKSIREAEGTLKVVVSGKALDIIIMVCLHQAFEIFEDVESAIASFVS